MWHMGDGWGWWMSMGWVWMVVFWGLVIYGINARLTGRSAGTPSHSEPNAREIVARRYANGELTDEQFTAMQARLAAAPTLPDPVASSAPTSSRT